MECVLEHFYDYTGAEGYVTGTLVVGRVKLFHVREDLLNDDLIVDTAALQPISRLGGISYGRTVQAFDLARPFWEKEKDKEEIKAAIEKGEKKAEAKY